MATNTTPAPRKGMTSEDEIFSQAERAEEEASEDEIFQAAEEAEADTTDAAPDATPADAVPFPKPGEFVRIPFSPEESARVNPPWDGFTMGNGPPPLPTPPTEPLADASDESRREGYVARYLRDKMNRIRARTAGVLDYSTSGFADELFGLTRLPTEVTRGIINDTPVPQNAEEGRKLYTKLRDVYRDEDAALRDAYGGDYHAYGIASSMLMPSPKAPGPLGPVMTGGLQGLLSGVGGSKAELTDPTVADLVQIKHDADWGTGIGAAFGAGGQALANGAEYLGPKVGPWLKTYLTRKANEKALKSVTGRNLPLWQRLLSDDPERVQEIGADLLDQKVLDSSVPSITGRPVGFWDKILPGISVEEARKRASEVAAREGKNIDTALKEVDALIPEDQRWWKYDIAKEIEDYLVRPRKGMTAGDEPIAKRLQAEADKIRQHSMESRPTLEQMEQYKRGLDKFIDHDTPAMKPMSDALDDLRDRLNFNIEQKAWSAAEAAGSDAAQRFQEAKRLFGNMATIADPASKQSARELTNRMFSASDYGLGAATALSSSSESSPVATGLKGLVAAAFNKLARERGNQALATGMKSLSQSDALEQMIRLQPEALGSYAQPLTDAFARGGKSALAIQDFLLGNTDEQYRELRRRLPSLVTGRPVEE